MQDSPNIDIAKDIEEEEFEMDHAFYMEFEYPFPSCNMEHYNYDPNYNIGYVQGVFADGVPFLAELWRDRKTKDKNITIIIPYIDAIIEEIEQANTNEEEEQSNVEGYQTQYECNGSSILCDDMVIIDEINDIMALESIIYYLTERGIISFPGDMHNGHAFILEDYDGKEIIALDISLETNGVTYAVTPLNFTPFDSKIAQRENMKAKLKVISSEQQPVME